MDGDVRTILNENEIEALEKIVFASDDEKFKFIKDLEKITSNKINLKFVNNDLKDIFVKIKVDDEVVSILRKFNFDDYYSVFANRNKSKREGRIYDDFIYFLKLKLGILEDELFLEKENFDIDSDSLKKAEKYGVGVVFDYCFRGKKNTVNDFVLYFNKRLEHFASILEDMVDLDKLMRISGLEDAYGTNNEVNLIGLVSDISKTKNGHIVFTLEDKSGEVKCFINKSKLNGDSFKNKVDNMCLDEGIGVVGKAGDKIVWVDDIILVSAKEKEVVKTDDENFIVCLGDLHIGSKNFVDESFEKFVDWINSNTSNDKLNEIAKKVKYIFIVGDMIEGLGIYPNQGKDARIVSTSFQYERAAQLLSKIPKDKCIINICGNHDTTRLSEPQPKLSYDKAYALYNMENMINLSNPSIVRLFDKLDFYLYHGGSIFYYADNIQRLRDMGGAKVPEKVIAYLLEKRHIAPSHGSTLYVPDSQQDPLRIDNMPDFFLCGHTHKMSVLNHKGCSILNCGCWNTITDYQEKMGMYPDVGKCILVNTKTRDVKILNFHKEN